MKKVCVILIVLFVAEQNTAFAHDIGSSNATFWIRTTGIDVELVMGLNAGALLIAPEGTIISITPYTFSQCTDRLRSAGGALFTLTGPDGAILNFDSVAVSLTDQADVRFDLHYPLPAALPGALKIRSEFLGRMVDNHVESIEVMNSRGDRLGWADIRPDAPDWAVNLPTVGPLAPARSPLAEVSSTPIPTAENPAAPWYLWVFLIFSAGLIVAVTLCGISRQNRDRQSAA